MKHGISLVIILIIFNFYLQAQKTNCDTSHLKGLPIILWRNIPSADSGPIDCNYTGAFILEFFKEKDSIKIKSLYASCYGFDYTDDKRLKKIINKFYIDSIAAGCKVVFPFYYKYKPDSILYEPSVKEKLAVKKILTTLKPPQFYVCDISEFILYGVIKDVITPDEIISTRYQYIPVAHEKLPENKPLQIEQPLQGRVY